MRLYYSIWWPILLTLESGIVYVYSVNGGSGVGVGVGGGGGGGVLAYKNELGYCEPLTLQVLSGLLKKLVRLLFAPGRDVPSIQQPIKQKDLRYDLYTRRNPYERQLLATYDRKALLRSNFNSSWPVRFTLHGWNGKSRTCSNAAIKDSYLARGDFNIILVDWSDYSLNINYIHVINEVMEIAEKFNQFTRFLHYWTNIPYHDMYLIGHSIGCHIAGLAGRLLKPLQYGVIYALDPAGPIHVLLNENWRLTPSDALYVESIQTDINLLGFPSAQLGQASFFPNWALGQPHCPNVTRMEPYYACDHFSSLYYFVESIRNPKAFGAIRCKNFDSILKQTCSCGNRDRNHGNKLCSAQVFMGGEPAIPKRGIFYVSTRSQRPFGYGQVMWLNKALRPTVLRASQELPNEILKTVGSR